MMLMIEQIVVAILVIYKWGRWIEDWKFEDVEFWDKGGFKVVCRNLIFLIFSEHIGFLIWVFWLVFVLFLLVGVYGFSIDVLIMVG